MGGVAAGIQESARAFADGHHAITVFDQLPVGQTLDDPLPPGLSQWRRRRLVLLDQPSAVLLGLPTDTRRHRRWDPASPLKRQPADPSQAPKRRRKRQPVDPLDEGLDPFLNFAHPEERHVAEPFAMLWLEGVPRLLELVRDGRLEPEDLATLLAMASLMRLRASGRVEATPAELAAVVQCPPDRLGESLDRLLLAGVIALWERPRARVRLGYLVDPSLLSQGSASCRGFALTVFAEARQRTLEGGAAAGPTADNGGPSGAAGGAEALVDAEGGQLLEADDLGQGEADEPAITPGQSGARFPLERSAPLQVA